MGRITRSYRERLQRQMVQLKRKYRESFKDVNLKFAFDEIFDAWVKEMGAMIYSGIPSTLGPLLLTGIVDNRREVEEIHRRLEALKKASIVCGHCGQRIPLSQVLRGEL